MKCYTFLVEIRPFPEKKPQSCKPPSSLISLGRGTKIFCLVLLLCLVLSCYQLSVKYLTGTFCLILGSFAWAEELVPIFPNTAQSFLRRVIRIHSHSWKPAEAGVTAAYVVPCCVFCKNYSVLLEFCGE